LQPAVDPAAETAQPAELPMRVWNDNTGKFQIRGRLAEVQEGKVRIFKENGRFTTVPMDRLSPPDRDYVEQKFAEFGNGEIATLAAR
jgi:hypothetical protein